MEAFDAGRDTGEPPLPDELRYWLLDDDGVGGGELRTDDRVVELPTPGLPNEEELWHVWCVH